LRASLRDDAEVWRAHLVDGVCAAGSCTAPHAAPCQQTCPANIDIPSFMAHIGHGRYREALAVITRDNPLPLTCGLVCPAPCENACLRQGSDAAVFIRPMKAVAAEHCLAEDGTYPRPEIATDTGFHVGIVGSGPAGLAAAYYLRLLGHRVTIYERQEKAGGMLRYGIPAYRLPSDLLDQELRQITALGITLHTGYKVASIEALRAEHDALFLALGTQTSRILPVPGAQGDNVGGGIDFLRAVRSGADLRMPPRVVVIGGGNVAIDVALTALRQGAEQVGMVCLEAREAMPCNPHELATAEEEGVNIHAGWGPLRFGAEAEFQRCLAVLDAEGRFNPRFDSAQTLRLPADRILFAVGQGSELSALQGSQVEAQRGLIVTDPKTWQTTEDGIFAGGDVATGPRTAVEAIRSGKIAAANIHAWLTHARRDLRIGRPQRRDRVDPIAVDAHERTHHARAQMPQLPVEARHCNYCQIEQGLTDGMAHDEAARCLRCDLCIGCGLCQLACSEMGIEALRMADTAAGRLAFFDFERPAERCIGCGACAQVCPTAAIRIEDSDGVRRTVITGTVVREQPLAHCAACGAPMVTPLHRDYVGNHLTGFDSGHLQAGLCPACARRERPPPRHVALGA
jgi:NADPH-dependent glutamate synthase beta subunit-like oxidoreductase/ferredoxin